MLRIDASPLLLMPRVAVEESHDAFFGGRELASVSVECVSPTEPLHFFNEFFALFCGLKDPYFACGVFCVSDPN